MRSSTFPHSIVTRSRSLALVALWALGAGSGCIALKADQDEIAKEVDKLRKEVLASNETAERNQALADEVEAKLKEVEELLRRNQADLGLRVENLELQVQELRGAAENADYMATAAKQELLELRADLDARITALEEKLNEATNIPESKTELLAEAEKHMGKRNYKQARRLYRTYESRYPGDAQMPDVRFKIGLTYFSERDYKSSLGEFYRIIQDSPESPIVPDALYYSGLAFAKLGQCNNAIAYFEALTEKKMKAPQNYKDKAAEQIGILKKDKGELCMDKAAEGGQ
ncbi:tetratricopeptide repeat protein [Paraliomyxa miuraensis]|uniref:tetratricopeptide repeat protein n=1 Tax=Paraliomyxa miuraensis TaxID=376150 RepID=UPI002254692C|nr:tetratricopeptide repeat protein [Paraliomyxa miuraensis]MCX4241123.1 tetratricopeptide repeat protein [Paraliomyxa miuraensis]